MLVRKPLRVNFGNKKMNNFVITKSKKVKMFRRKVTTKDESNNLLSVFDGVSSKLICSFRCAEESKTGHYRVVLRKHLNKIQLVWIILINQH